MKIITFASAKGGVGKSSLSFNMANITAKKNRVLFIDLDAQGNTTAMFKKSDSNIYQVLNNEMPITQAIRHDEEQGMDYVASSSKIKLLNPHDLTLLSKHLKNLNYDYIFVDTPPALSNITLNGIVSSDMVVIPIQLDLFSAQGLVSIIGTVQSYNNKAKIVIAPNQIVHNSKLHKNNLDQLTKYIETKDGVKMAKPLPSSVIMSESLANKKSVADFKRLHKLNKPLKTLQKEIINYV